MRNALIKNNVINKDMYFKTLSYDIQLNFLLYLFVND